jgi:GNAT superfamily N-acetyltransferase
MQIREATDGDWASIWPFFREIVDDGETYAYPHGLDSETASALWMAPPPDRCVVAVNDSGRVVASAKMGPNRPGRGAHISTASFMVGPGAQGLGVGRALGEHVLAWAREQGYAGMQFNAVVETNTRAVHLWQELGFTIVGIVPGAFESRRHGRVGLHVMYRDL